MDVSTKHAPELNVARQLANCPVTQEVLTSIKCVIGSGFCLTPVDVQIEMSARGEHVPAVTV